MKLRIPYRYKISLVLVSLLILSQGAALVFAWKTFTDDKKLYVMETQVSLLESVSTGFSSELKSRIEALTRVFPTLLAFSGAKRVSLTTVNPELNVPEDLIGITFLKLTPSAVETEREFINEKFFAKSQRSQDDFQTVQSSSPIPRDKLEKDSSMFLMNRSLKWQRPDGTQVETGILTIVFPFASVQKSEERRWVLVDLEQSFLQALLRRSELSEMFLVTQSAELLSHGSTSHTVQFAHTAFQHPALEKVKTGKFGSGTFACEVNQKMHQCSVGRTPFENVYLISQVPDSLIQGAVRKLTIQTLIVGVAAIYLALMASLFLSRVLSSSLQRLNSAAEQVGKGDLDIKVDIQTGDEFSQVGQRFEWMASQVKNLIQQTAQQSRMESELQTVQAVQSTVLSIPKLSAPEYDLILHNSPASECGGDLWHARVDGEWLTLLVGDATGHGAPAAIVSTIAKTVMVTVDEIWDQEAFSPEKMLKLLNSVVCHSCHGKLLVTLSLVRLNTHTGEVWHCNAGHEAPLHFLMPPPEAGSAKPRGEPIVATGERLGYDPAAQFQAVKSQLTPSDLLVLYSDGITEAKNPDGKDWGERKFKKSICSHFAKPVEEVKGEVMNDLLVHTQGHPQADDLTFLILRWNGPKTEPAMTPPTETAEPKDVNVARRLNYT